jgi:hypothetical protein
MLFRCRFVALVGALALSIVVPGTSADTAKAGKKKVVPATKVDPSLEHVDVFEGIEKGMLEIKMLPKDAMGGNMFIENKTDKPLNVDFPPAFIGKQVLKQFGQGGFGGQGGLGGGGLGGGGLGGGGLGGGGQQAQGGGFGGGGLGGGGLGGGGLGGGGLGGGGLGGGGGFFSVPPDRIVRAAYRSVCLEHGKPDPTPGSVYRIGKVAEISDDPVLEQTLILVASGQIDPQAGQAATWHLTNKMSWQELAAKAVPHIGRPATPYFSAETLARAQNIHFVAVARAKELEEKNGTSTSASAKDSSRAAATVKRD